MPELPEVTTTVKGINELAKGLIIRDVWSDWPKLIKFPDFKKFKKDIIDKKILGAERRGKNILINLSGDKTLLVHMKMTGHLMHGEWESANEGWRPKETDKNHPLNDPYNRFIHLILFLSNGRQLALCDVRKFAKVLLLNSGEIKNHPDLKVLGPEPLDRSFTLQKMIARLKIKSNWPIKQALMNQELVAGIGNIYSDEILWSSGVHPLQKVRMVDEKKMAEIYRAMRSILKKSIQLGGDSTSDYRNIYGERGGFQKMHMAYRRTGEPCAKGGCRGKISRIKVAGRSAHFCGEHQRLH